MQETIISGPTCPSMQKKTKKRGNFPHLPAQSAHATMHREVELTKCRLEASSNPAVWRRCDERKQERQKSCRLRRSSGRKEEKRLWRIEKKSENKDEGVAAVLRQLAEVRTEQEAHVSETVMQSSSPLLDEMTKFEWRKLSHSCSVQNNQ